MRYMAFVIAAALIVLSAARSYALSGTIDGPFSYKIYFIESHEDVEKLLDSQKGSELGQSYCPGCQESGTLIAFAIDLGFYLGAPRLQEDLEYFVHRLQWKEDVFVYLYRKDLNPIPQLAFEQAVKPLFGTIMTLEGKSLEACQGARIVGFFTSPEGMNPAALCHFSLPEVALSDPRALLTILAIGDWRDRRWGLHRGKLA